MSDRLLILTIGLSRSGKTTWARQQGVPIVSPDAIRLALHGKRFLSHTEPFVWAIAKTMVRALFLAGHPRVIVDATNTTRRRRDEWRDPQWTLAFKLLETPPEECLQRAALEGDTYIMPIIERQAAQFEAPSALEQPYVVIGESLEADALAAYGLTPDGHLA